MKHLKFKEIGGQSFKYGNEEPGDWGLLSLLEIDGGA